MARILTSILTLSAIVLFWSGQTAAQEPTFSSTVAYEFGQQMRFNLMAEGIPEVTAVSLFISAPEFPNALTESVPFTQTDKLVAVHVANLGQVRLAPFTTVTWWWVLTTTAGDLITVPEQQLFYNDDQFDWKTKVDGNVMVNWTGDDPALGQLALDIVAESLPGLRDLVPVKEEMPLRIYIYPSSADLRAALRLAGRDWVGAHAHPELGVILVTAVNPRTAATDLRQSLPHELVHFLLYQVAGARYESLPVWLSEGLATLAESIPNPSYAVVLETAVANQNTLPFTQLCATFPTTEPEILMAYAQSYSMIQYIQANYGSRALREMVLAAADGADCQTVVSRTLGQTLPDLTEAWLGSLQPRSSWTQFWLDNGILFVMLLAGFAITGLLLFNPGRK